MASTLRTHELPAALMLLLHYHFVAKPAHDSPGNRRYTERFLHEGLIVEHSDSPSGYVTTARGRAYVQMLCATPLPEQHWLDPRTHEPSDD